MSNKKKELVERLCFVVGELNELEGMENEASFIQIAADQIAEQVPGFWDNYSAKGCAKEHPAHQVKHHLSNLGHQMSLGHCHELIARMNGFKSQNHAAADDKRLVQTWSDFIHFINDKKCKVIIVDQRATFCSDPIDEVDPDDDEFQVEFTMQIETHGRTFQVGWYSYDSGFCFRELGVESGIKEYTRKSSEVESSVSQKINVDLLPDELKGLTRQELELEEFYNPGIRKKDGAKVEVQQISNGKVMIKINDDASEAAEFPSTNKTYRFIKDTYLSGPKYHEVEGHEWDYEKQMYVDKSK